MEYIAAADTDIGTTKQVNQDSVCVKTAKCRQGRAALIMVCDGMGGLSKGELASAAVVRSFSDWFEYDLPYELDNWNWKDIGRKVAGRLIKLNNRIVEHGKKCDLQLGTTCTGILAFNSEMMTFHVGDTRIYKLSGSLNILTEDHTFVRREVKRGNMTPEEALKDPRRNALTNCLGVTGSVEPDITFGNVDCGANYLICSDGFRHVITEDEIYNNLSPERVTTKTAMQAKLRQLIDTVKKREERDNISAAMFRAEA